MVSQITMFRSLFKADAIVQLRNIKAVLLSAGLPILLLVVWRSFIADLGREHALAMLITVALMGVGIASYAMTVAADRDRGVFQRLRATPASSSVIMSSRLAVQLLVIMVISAIVCVAGYFIDDIRLHLGGYLLLVPAIILGGAVALGIGQALVGLVRSAETVNSGGRNLLFALVIIGVVGGMGILGDTVKEVARWTPFGSVQSVMEGTMHISKWGQHNEWVMLGLTAIYALVSIGIGIKYFRWDTA